MKSNKKKLKSGKIYELINTLVIALLLAGLIRTVLFQPFWIPTGSMKPNLLVGDFLFVNKFAYGFSRYSCPFSSLCQFSGRIFFSEPRRGDVVVFRHPFNGKDYIKRLIGLPGDKIKIENGVVFINEEEIKQDKLTDFIEEKKVQGSMNSLPMCANFVPIGSKNCIKYQAKEKLSEGIEYSILDLGQQKDDNTQDFIVGKGKYFFMGDNRDNSLDSRRDRQFGGVGLVPAEYLIGKASIVIFSSKGRSIFYFWTWRKDRFFKVIN